MVTKKSFGRKIHVDMATSHSQKKSTRIKKTIIPEPVACLPNIPKYFILGGLITLLVGTILIIKPFFAPLVIGAIIATGFYPLHLKIVKWVPKRTWSSIISFLIILAIILIPVTWFVNYITQQAIDTYILIESKVDELLELDIRVLPEIVNQSAIGKYLLQWESYLPIQPKDIIGFATEGIQNVSQFLVNQTTNFAKQLSVLAIHLFVLFISIFFFLRDGDRVVLEIKALLPLAPEYREEIFKKLKNMSRGVIYGIFGTAIAQGFLGGIGFAIAGIHNAAFWGTIMGFCSMVPYIGTTLIWIPASIVLILTGHVLGAVFLILWGILIVGTMDNFLKPFLIGEKAHIHPLLSFLAILGGIFTMGLPGLILAPFILALALAFLHIYKLEYKNILEQK